MKKLFFASLVLALALPSGSLAQTTRITPYSSTACARNRSFLAIFPSDRIVCGKTGATFPPLIGGQCPLTACMLKPRINTNTPFGTLDF